MSAAPRPNAGRPTKAAVRLVECPRCGAPPRSSCFNERARNHAERVARYRDGVYYASGVSA